MRLIPEPRTVRPFNGRFPFDEVRTIRAASRLEPPEERALQQFLDRCEKGAGGRPRLVRSPAADVAPSIEIRIDASGNLDPNTAGGQGYQCRVTPDRIELIGRSGAGLSHGLSSLWQMLGEYGDSWPCMEIEDRPDFAVRGLSFDVSRGRVPTLETLKALVDTLAGLKVNLLQLYIEHTFAFRFNPDISRGCSPLTADEISELDAYCAERRVWLVPCIASFGHMGRVLGLPEYRHLAEVEPERPWETLSWRERMRGLTLDPCQPESRDLLERMYGELVPLFSSPWVNVSGDETYDLGRGRNRVRAEREGVGRLYLEHLHWLHGLCARHGKRMLFWGDIIKKYPDLIREVPRDAVVLDWDYAAEPDEGGLELFTGAGLETWVCPGTCSWNRIINDLGTAECNIRRFAEAGRRHGAIGLLNTDWGDEGHFNMLATSWHPIYLGAALAWNATAPAQGDFDRRFARMRLGDPEGHCMTALRRVLEASDLLRSWPLLAAPLGECAAAAAEAGEARLDGWRQRSLEAADLFAARADADPDARESALACRINALLADKLQLVREITAAAGGRLPQTRLDTFAAACGSAAKEYERVWLVRNKPERLGEILAVFDRLAHEARALASASAPCENAPRVPRASGVGD